MQTQLNRAERPVGVLAAQAPKVASPLHREINELKDVIQHQRELLDTLKMRLSPLFQERPGTGQDEKPDEIIAEVPAQVRSCRILVRENTSIVNYLLEQLEV
jgi:hypothetical protein